MDKKQSTSCFTTRFIDVTVELKQDVLPFQKENPKKVYSPKMFKCVKDVSTAVFEGSHGVCNVIMFVHNTGASRKKVHLAITSIQCTELHLTLVITAEIWY